MWNTLTFLQVFFVPLGRYGNGSRDRRSWGDGGGEGGGSVMITYVRRLKVIFRDPHKEIPPISVYLQ